MKLSGISVLVTGATGFLGSALVRRLASEGALVKGLARHPERGEVLGKLDGVEILQGDITDADQMCAVSQGCIFVFHTAAVANGPSKMLYDINVGGTSNVMMAAAKAGVQRVIHVSSVGPYAIGRSGDISEGLLPGPIHAAYGTTKIEADQVVRRIANEQGLDYSIIRPGMPYGPRSTIWTEAMYKLARRSPIIFLGDGSGSIPAIHVEDVVDLMVVLAIHPAASGQTFNCTPDPAPTWREFLGAYAALTGPSSWLAIPVLPLRMITRGVASLAPGDSRFKDLPLVVDFLTRYRRYRMDKARELLGWQPKVALSEGVQSCTAYLREKGLLK